MMLSWSNGYMWIIMETVEPTYLLCGDSKFQIYKSEMRKSKSLKQAGLFQAFGV